MYRLTRIALISVLALAFVALEARSDSKKQSTSRNNPVQSKITQKGKDKGKTPDKTQVIQGNFQKVPVAKTIHPTNPIDQGKLKGPLSKPMVESLKKVGSNPNVAPGAQGAINTLVSGNFLSTDQRQDLTDLVAANSANLGEDDLKAVQAALDYDARAKREQRYLELENATGERLTVWLHYQTFDEEQKLSWYPTRPVDAEKALHYVLEPNAKLPLGDGKNKIAAARVRVWAESDSGQKWLTYRDSDLRLKPEKKDSREMGTYPLRLVGAETGTEQASK
jgi:hypothetical protein